MAPEIPTERSAMGYRGKVHEQQQACQLRSEGWALQDIADELGVAKSSVSVWVRGVSVGNQPRRRVPRQRPPNALQRRKQAEIDRSDAWGRSQLGVIDRQAFLAAGAALYAGEGDKRDGTVAFANSDERMIAFFCRWLRAFFEVDESRLRVRLYLHQGLDLDAAAQHWAKVTGVPVAQFLRPYRAVADPSRRTNKHVHGCCHVRYSCAHTHREVMGLVKALLSCDALLPG